MSTNRFCNLVYYWLTQGADEASQRAIDTKLWMPPAGSAEPIPEESPWSPENETAAFAGLKASIDGM